MRSMNSYHSHILNKGISELEDTSLVVALASLFGPTGCEDRVAHFALEEARRLCDSASCDRMGNVVGRISLGDPKKRKRVMLSAHTDEVGFMIEEIKSDGMLTFGCLGGMDPAILAGKRVLVGNEKTLINGVICSKAIHHKKKSERDSAVDSDKLYIDAGFTSREEAGAEISIGDFATFDEPADNSFTFGKDGQTLKMKALDDRMGCAVLIELMRKLNRERESLSLNLDVYFCFTVREETGCSGAIVVSEKIAPDFALVFESTAVGDIPDAPSEKRVAELGGGAVISVADRSTIYDAELIDTAFAMARKKEIPLQVKRYLSGGNDAGHIHKSGVGVRSLAISVPTRYLHSQTCVAHCEDYRSARAIGFAMLEAISEI